MSHMIENTEEYFSGLIPPRDELLLELEREAEEKGIPIVGPVVGELIYILARVSKAHRVLELGTATGYSGIYLARAVQTLGGKLVTCENNPETAEKARVNFERAGLQTCVEIKIGDALHTLGRLQRLFDFIFLDIEKKDYIHALPDCKRLLNTNGLLVADNTSFSDACPFNDEIAHDKSWKSVQLLSFLPRHSPNHDGLCIALRV